MRLPAMPARMMFECTANVAALGFAKALALVSALNAQLNVCWGVHLLVGDPETPLRIRQSLPRLGHRPRL